MKEVHPSVREIAVLQEATEMILASTDVDTVLHQILLIVRNYFGVAHSAVFLVDRGAGELYCRAQIGYDDSISAHRLRIGVDGVVGAAAQARSPLCVPDVSQEPRYIPGSPDVRSTLALPLIVREQVVGVLAAESSELDYFSPDLSALLNLFASQAAVALENARLFASERRRVRQIELINLIARSAASAAELEQFLGTLAELIGDSFEGAEVVILLREPDGSLRPRASAGAEGLADARFAESERSGIIAQGFAARQHVVVNDIRAKAGWPACLPGAGSELCAPLVSFGETLGVVVVSHPHSGFFSEDERAIAQAAADVCATAIKNVQLAEELRRVAHTDFVTGVYNQRYFHTAVSQELARSKRYGKPFALAMLDLRAFRDVNSSLGFEGGDTILRQVAQLLRSQVRSMDVLCRYAGDRFALVLPETDRDRMAVVLRKIEENLARIRIPGKDGEEPLVATCAFVNYPHDAGNALELTRLLFARVDEVKRSRTGP
ncbi:MAG TPA: GAF domain-containing protein [Terriglobales bacterium]|nr:GAF domain-containing protein [Terriglobales bacterium]